MQISAPAPILYLPENLWIFFDRPGRELLVRVLSVEGKTLHLELGGEKFQARIAGTLNPEDFKVGENLKVKVIKTGNPIVLQIISSEKKTQDLKFLYLLTNLSRKEVYSTEVVEKDVRVLTTLLQGTLLREKKEKRVEEDLRGILGDRAKVYDMIFQDEKVIIPFLFEDDRSWGYLELGVPEFKKGKIKVFLVKFYGEYLGLMECYLFYKEDRIGLEIYFSNKEAYEMAKRELNSLKSFFSNSKIGVKIELELQEFHSGRILETKV